MAADIVKQGYVKFLSKNLGNLGVWNRKWLMLRRQSCKGPVRLEKYKDEATASVMSIYGADKKIIDLTRVERIERLPESVKKHGINILADVSLSIQFCVGSEMEAEGWLSAIRDEIHPENRQTHESFAVYMLPNDYMSTPGDCTLQLTRDSLQLLERYGGRQLASWPFSGLRRFGVDRNMFTFEAGSSCPTGEGTYFFSGGDSEFIYQRVQTLSQASSRTSSSGGNLQNSFSMSNWGNVASISELSNQRRGGGGGGTGEQAMIDQENAYTIDTTMPTPRPPSERLNNSMQRSAGPSNRGRGPNSQQSEYAYSELPADGQRNVWTTADVPRLPPSRSNTIGASTSSSMQVQSVEGPYYAVTQRKTPNQTANQEQRTTVQANQAPAANGTLGSRRAPMERSRTVEGSHGPPRDSGASTRPRDSAEPTAEGRIRAVRVGGDYYAVPRGKNSNTQVQQEGSSDLIQFDQANDQPRASSGRIPVYSAAGQGARASEESPYYAVSEMYGSADQDDDNDDGVYSVPPVRPGGPRTVRR